MQVKKQKHDAAEAEKDPELKKKVEKAVRE